MRDKTETNNEFRPWGMDVNQYCMLMHLSQLAGYVVPLVGLALPIIMWATNKDQSTLIDENGKNILNWIISSIIYVVLCMILMIVFIGIIGLFAFAILALIFTILGAIKANEGGVYKYPLAFTFIK